jgi:hypothetical protein
MPERLTTGQTPDERVVLRAVEPPLESRHEVAKVSGEQGGMSTQRPGKERSQLVRRPAGARPESPPAFSRRSDGTPPASRDPHCGGPLPRVRRGSLQDGHACGTQYWHTQHWPHTYLSLPRKNVLILGASTTAPQHRAWQQYAPGWPAIGHRSRYSSTPPG